MDTLKDVLGPRYEEVKTIKLDVANAYFMAARGAAHDCLERLNARDESARIWRNIIPFL
jgi:hypothetical protein